MADQKRVLRYPVVVEQPLSLYMVENYNLSTLAHDACDKLEKLATATLALDPTVSIIRLVIANNESPDGDMESYNYLILGVFFNNITGDELTGYANKLNAALSSNATAIYTHPDGRDLPSPEAYVPTYEWINRQREELSSLSSRTRGWFNSDGSINSEVVDDSTRKWAENNNFESNAGGNNAAAARVSPASTTVGDTSPANGFDADDFDEFEMI